MSQLIYLRQRIAAIETVKKITHAMRLISMSSHSRLRAKEKLLVACRQEINRLFTNIHRLSGIEEFASETSPIQEDSRTLLIVIGSQKGLCGSFNSSLFSFFRQIVAQSNTEIAIIAVGKSAVDYLDSHEKERCIAFLHPLTQYRLTAITQEVVNLIEAAPYHSVAVVSNVVKNFFLQVPTVTQLLPVTPPAASATVAPAHADYLWEEQPRDVFKTIFKIYLAHSLEHALFQSLVAEQAARFISMDNATRNAENLLNETKLQYNKLRQARITKELIELMGNF